MVKSIILIAFVLLCNAKINAQWSPINSGTSNFLIDVFFVNDSFGFVADEGHRIHQTIDGGLTWTTSIDSLGTTLFFLDTDTGFAGGKNIFKTVDGGNTWTKIFQTTQLINSFCFPGNKNFGYASANHFDSTIIYKSIDRGNSWNEISGFATPFGMGFTGLAFPSVDTGYLVSDGIYKTIDGGSNWILIDSFFLGQNIFFPSVDTGYVVGLGGILKTTDGNHWFPLTLPFSNLTYNALFFSSADSGYVVGGNGWNLGAILRTVDGGLNWTYEISTPYPFQSVYFPSHEAGYACGDNGTIYKTNSNVLAQEINKNLSCKIYPNPSSNKFNVLVNNKTQKLKFEVYNFYGILILESVDAEVIDLSDFAKGIYIAKIMTDSGFNYNKLILQ
jgi:photosystem II stability/assembly factor-like uncharacterized protein